MIEKRDDEFFLQVRCGRLINAHEIDRAAREGLVKVAVAFKRDKEKLPVSQRNFYVFKQNLISSTGAAFGHKKRRTPRRY